MPQIPEFVSGEEEHEIRTAIENGEGRTLDVDWNRIPRRRPGKKLKGYISRSYNAAAPGYFVKYMVRGTSFRLYFGDNSLGGKKKALAKALQVQRMVNRILRAALQ